jgi:tRNA dimethylallyltransferase
MKPLIVIVGPTGIGKSKTAFNLAQGFNGEIVSADSRQVYRYMDIGTAKPSHQELALIPHHLIDSVDPDENFSLAKYHNLTYRAVKDIQQRNKMALLVGGSGLYVWSVVEGWQIPRVPPDPEYRQKLEDKAEIAGGDKLYEELLELDPVIAKNIDKRNVRRIIRALEVHRKGSPSFRFQRKKAPRFKTLVIGLTADRETLYHRIDARVDEMVKRGLVKEVETLLAKGYSFELPSMSGIGYDQIGKFLKNELSLDSAIQQIKYETHRFVRHQYNWFRLKDDRIRWFDIRDEIGTGIDKLVVEFTGGVEVRQ